VSVGHAARAIEAAGIPTAAVFIRAFRHVGEAMALPRTLITPHLMGRTVGPPGAADRQRRVVEAALGLLVTAPAGGTVTQLD
jgi:hypothetical protein